METSFLGTSENELTYGGSKLYLYYFSLPSGWNYMQVIVEILLMLRGITGFIYHRDSINRTLTVNHKVVVSHLTPLILFQQLQNFAKFGNHILVISHFYSSHLLHHQLTNPILQALSAALREYCEYFYVYLSTLANKCEGLTLLELESVLAPKRRDIEILAQVLRKMGVGSPQSSSQEQVNGVVLGTLYDSACEMSLLGDAQGMGIILHLLVKTARPYFDALGTWLEEGTLPGDSERWFMVTRNEKRRGEENLAQAAPVSWGEGYVLRPERVPNFLQPVVNEILVAGKSIVLLREIFANFAMNHEKTPEQQQINIYVIGPAPVSLFEQFLQEVLQYFPQGNRSHNDSVVPRHQKLVARIKLDVEVDLAVPTAPFLGSISSYMGDEISPFLPHPDLQHGNHQQPPDNPEATKLFSPSPLPHLPNDFHGNFNKFSPLPENSFTLQPISVIIQRGLIEPILERYHAGSQKLMRYLHEICLLHQNLVNLRAFFLMEAGFAFHQFTISLFEKVDRGEVLGTYELNRILQESLICAGDRESYLIETRGREGGGRREGRMRRISFGDSCRYYKYRRLLSLELPEVPASAQTNPSSQPNGHKGGEKERGREGEGEGKNTTVLDFEPYTLPSLKAVYQVPSPLAIEATIRIGLKTNHPASSSIHPLHLLRAKLLHFVNNLQHYLFNRVLQTGWDEFMDGVVGAADLDDLVQKHATYVNKIFSQCLLNIKAAPVLSVIKRILTMALRFSRNFLQYEKYQEVSMDSLQQSTNSTTSSLNTSAVLDDILQEFGTIDTYVTQQVSLLVSILQDIVAQKTLPHLMDLLLRLNYNQHYRPL